MEPKQSSSGANDANGGTSPNTSGLMNTIREKTNTQLASQKDRAMEGFGSVVGAVRQTGQQLRDKNPALAGYVDKTAEQLERWASDIREKDVSELFDDVKSFAQRRPAVFLGGAVALGLVAARLAKSSGSEVPPTPRARDWSSRTSADEFTTGRSVSGGSPALDVAADRISPRSRA